MKLKGSQTEETFRRELLSSRSAILSGDYPKIGALLEAKYPEMKTAYVLGHTPEQGEDIFIVLVNTNILAKIEISHDIEVKPLVERIDLNEYKMRLSQAKQIQLSVALDLAEHEL